MNWAPVARIVLRYLVGGAIFGSAALGEKLAADPDLVAVSAMALGAAVEGAYIIAKRRGWAT